MAQLIRAIAKSDPAYTKKVKLVVEAINANLSPCEQLRLADVDRHVDFDANAGIHGDVRQLQATHLRLRPRVYTRAAFSAASTRASRNGTRLRRTPVASWIAFAIAASIGLHAASPAP